MASKDDPIEIASDNEDSSNCPPTPGAYVDISCNNLNNNGSSHEGISNGNGVSQKRNISDDLLTSKRRKMSSKSKTDSGSFKERLAEAVEKLSENAPIKFSFGGLADNLPSVPGFEVDGLGQVAFPINDTIAKQLVHICNRAPYGKGMDTIVDESVRKTWELDPSKFSIKNPSWNKGLSSLVHRVSLALGFNSSLVKPVLYKFLLYEKGGHFKVHRDTEKSPGMFASLLIQLPSVYQGGNLLVYHDGKTKRHDFGHKSGQNAYGVHFAAHFSDVEHEVEEVIEGYRCMLVYNLCWTGANTAPSCESLKLASQNVIDIITGEWKDSPEALIFPLDHLYSDAGLTFGASALKGHDSLLASALKIANENAKEDSGLALYIAKAEKDRTSTGDPPCYSSRRRRGYWGCYSDDDDSDDFDGCWDVCDESDSIGDWQTFDGVAVSHPETFGLDLESCVVSKCFDPDEFWGEAVEREKEGYMGNYGPQMTEIFQHFMIVVVKKSREELLVLEKGTINQISDHVLKKSGEQESNVKTLKDVEWLIDNRAEQLRGPANSSTNYYSSGVNCTAVNKILMAIANLKNAEIFHQFVSKIILSSNNIKAGDVENGLVECIRNLPFEEIKDNVMKIMKMQSKFSASQRYSWSSPPTNDTKLKVDVVGCIKILAKMAVMNLPNFSSICKEFFPIIEAEIKDIQTEHVEAFLSVIKKALPDSVEAFACKIIKVKSESNLQQCIALILRLLETKISNLPPLLEAALQKIKENLKTMKPSDIVEVISMMIKCKTCHELKEFANLIKTVVEDQNTLANILSQCESRFGKEKLKNELQPIVVARVELLSKMMMQEPKFSWCMPEASIPGHPQAEAMMRGPRDQFRYGKFNGIQHARNWISKHIKGTGLYSGGSSGFSAKAVEGGRGSSSYVKITKTNDHFKKQVAKYQTCKTELAKLRLLIV